MFSFDSRPFPPVGSRLVRLRVSICFNKLINFYFPSSLTVAPVLVWCCVLLLLFSQWFFLSAFSYVFQRMPAGFCFTHVRPRGYRLDFPCASDSRTGERCDSFPFNAATARTIEVHTPEIIWQFIVIYE